VCEQCEGLAERFNIREPSEYKDMAAKLMAMVDRGNLRVIEELGGTLKQVALCSTFPDDIIVHLLECTKCSAKFTLSADTYHGRVSWSSQVG
jgi:ribosomal protein L44E